MSQCAQILALLEERPRTTREILAEVPCIVHSRVAELRKQGHNIVCETIGRGAAGHRYHLMSSTEPAGPPAGSGDLIEAGSPAPLPASEHVTAQASSGAGPLADEDRELTLEEIAQLNEYEQQVRERIAATPHLDHENARDTLERIAHARGRLEATL